MGPGAQDNLEMGRLWGPTIIPHLGAQIGNGHPVTQIGLEDRDGDASEGAFACQRRRGSRKIENSMQSDVY